ncbi:MAG: NADH-quinone oxidoreductase subunit A [Coriobacteriia bacterium]|nr:NADH-quinone oxidoreductase subunit A [Coriobacteriia bacterium]
MQAAAPQDVMLVLGLAFAAVAFILVVLGLNAVLAPRRPTPEKVEPYECGMPQAGGPWGPVNVRFSTIALLFVLFDAEAILLFAVAPRLRGSAVGLLEVGAFAALLAFGLFYAWRKGALQWR